jgi:hypothetical protein
MTLRKRYWFEMIAGLGAIPLFTLTLIWRNWIEIVFRVDPDHGSGSLEMAILFVCILAFLSSMLAARIEWRRAVRMAA